MQMHFAHFSPAAGDGDVPLLSKGGQNEVATRDRRSKKGCPHYNLNCVPIFIPPSLTASGELSWRAKAVTAFSNLLWSYYADVSPTDFAFSTFGLKIRTTEPSFM
ncbi:hypothetical protein VUR80DRAFT_7626 [Thermomyces stellatus]